MAHEILGKRFHSLKVPGWHYIGTVHTEEFSAVEAYEYDGEFYIERRPIYTIVNEGMQLWTGREMLVRTPVPEDPQERIFGDVSDRYEILQPGDFARLWDEEVPGATIETYGVLKQGRIQWFTCKLPTVEIGGSDPVENYLLVQNGLDGGHGVLIRQSPVRVVCANTLAASESMSTMEIRLNHTGNLEGQLREGLRGIWERAVEQAEVLAEVYDVFTQARITDEEAQSVIDRVYPMPKRPVLADVARGEIMEARAKRWAYDSDLINIRRGGVMDLYHGAEQTTFVSPEHYETAWALYNAIVEAEDYRRGGSDEGAIASAIFGGGRLKNKQKAFELTSELAGVDLSKAKVLVR